MVGVVERRVCDYLSDAKGDTPENPLPCRPYQHIRCAAGQAAMTATALSIRLCASAMVARRACGLLGTAAQAARHSVRATEGSPSGTRYAMHAPPMLRAHHYAQRCEVQQQMLRKFSS